MNWAKELTKKLNGKIQKTFIILFLTLSGGAMLLYSNALLAQDVCDILIHGYTKNGKKYFKKMPRQVVWNSQQNIEQAAPLMAKKILEHANQCDANMPVVLRAHSYGAAVAFYILGQGKKFADLMPDHDFVKVYKRTTALYSFTGAHRGTYLMDLVCSSHVIKFIMKLFGSKCVPSLSTEKIYHAANEVTDPGVPVYLIHSTDDGAYLGITGSILGARGISDEDYEKGVRHQNDSVLPQFSTRGCAQHKVMTNGLEDCEKINENYMINFLRTKKFSHNKFRKKADFMFQVYKGKEE